MGIFVFCILYIKNVEGRFFDAIRDPLTISVFLIPFIPAAFLSWLADRNEKKYEKVAGEKKA